MEQELRDQFHLSAIYKIEKGERRVTIDELAAFAQIFGKSLDDMVLDPALEWPQRAWDLWSQLRAAVAIWTAHARAAEEANVEVDRLMVEYNDVLENHPEIRETINARIAGTNAQADHEKLVNELLGGMPRVTTPGRKSARSRAR